MVVMAPMGVAVVLEAFHTSKGCRQTLEWEELVVQAKIYARSLLNNLLRERQRVDPQARTFQTLIQAQALLLQKFGAKRIRSTKRKRNHRKTRNHHLLIQIPMTLIQTLMTMMMKRARRSFFLPLAVSLKRNNPKMKEKQLVNIAKSLSIKSHQASIRRAKRRKKREKAGQLLSQISRSPHLLALSQEWRAQTMMKMRMMTCLWERKEVITITSIFTTITIIITNLTEVATPREPETVVTRKNLQVLHLNGVINAE